MKIYQQQKELLFIELQVVEGQAMTVLFNVLN